MRTKRLLAFVMALLTAAFAAACPAWAADVPYEETEEVEETVAPTEAPTEPRPSPEASGGYSAYAKKLDETVYDGELGAIYSKKSTTFRMWSPAASAVKTCIYKTGSDSEPGAQLISNNPMKYHESSGVWELTLKGDYKNYYYTYQVTVDGKTNELVDPYARAVGVNGNRGMIITLSDTDPEGWDADSFERADSAVDAVVWEVSVRDFSADESSGVSEQNRGKFLAFTEFGATVDSKGSTAAGIAYLRDMGVNYVQINPFYDFASIDESDTQNPQYNWGYDPKNYNVPEGSYSSDPYDGRVRIKECKEMIQALHDAGIGVIMDVVYNHTYYSEESFFNYAVPYYYHRVNEDGSWSNGSGCGNDVATERYMVSRFIMDSVAYWAEEYHIDGFRFDLMGLMDVDTVNGIRARLDKLKDGKRIIMYGEAWNMDTSAPIDVKLADQSNMYLLSDRVGAFNDTGRDAIKGSNFNAPEGGFVQTGKNKSGVSSAISADAGGWASRPDQCVNYVSCHDNLTLYDKLTASVYGDEGYELRREDLVGMNRLSAAIVMMSRGMPFMLAGEEMGRTKLGDSNSYKSDVEINSIKWGELEKYTSLVDYYKGLIALRQAVGLFSDPTGKSTKLEYLKPQGDSAIAYELTGDGLPKLIAAFNGSADKEASVDLPEGEWVIVADKMRAGLNKLGSASGKVKVPARSAVVLIDSASFSGIGRDDNSAVTYVRYINKKDSSTVYELSAQGTMGESYSVTTPDSLLFRYDVRGGASSITGTFDELCKVVEVECEAYEGDYSFVTVKFVDDRGLQLFDSVLMKNRVGQQYLTQYIPGIPGYTLDLKNLPDNGAGLYTEEPIEVVYRYKPSPDVTDADSENNCRANVIYMSDSGKILASKSYMGPGGDALEVKKLEFEGYEFVGLSDEYAAFSEIEANVIAYYYQKRPKTALYIALGVAAALLAAGAAAFISGRSRRRKMSSMDIVE